MRVFFTICLLCLVLCPGAAAAEPEIPGLDQLWETAQGYAHSLKAPRKMTKALANASQTISSRNLFSDKHKILPFAIGYTIKSF